MKKMLIAVLICAVIVLPSGCKSLSSEVDSKIANIDLNDYDALTQEFLYPIAVAGITSYSWESSDEIKPDHFANFYEAKIISQIGHDKIIWDDNPFNAKLVENFIMQYFTIEQEYIRKSKFYDENDQTYRIHSLGGAASYGVIGAEINDDILELEYEYYDPADEVTVIRSGKIKIQLLPGSYNYISCDTTAASILQGH